MVSKMKTEEEIDQEFIELIKDLTEEQFWEWIATWKDQQDLIEQAEGWDKDTKIEEIAKLKEKLKLEE